MILLLLANMKKLFKIIKNIAAFPFKPFYNFVDETDKQKRCLTKRVCFFSDFIVNILLQLVTRHCFEVTIG